MTSEVIEYIVYLSDQSPVRFEVPLELNDVSYVIRNPDEAPEWAHLENHQCSHCPLSTETIPLCPLAERLVPFVNQLYHISSTEELSFTVHQSVRVKKMTAPAQDVLSSLLGLMIATSDCPHTSFLRPMAHFHLPLADEKETLYRVLSMYRLAQYFKKKSARKAFAEFDELNALYNNLVEVNRQLVRRIRDALAVKKGAEDALLHAIILLDALSQYVSDSIKEDMIGQLGPVFNTYQDDIGDECLKARE